MACGEDNCLEGLRDRLAEVVAAAPDLTEILRGTVRTRYVRCGKEGCHCQSDQGHGPVHYLSVTLSSGKSKQITLGKDTYELAKRYVENYQRLRAIVEEVSTINREMLVEKRRARRRQLGRADRR